MVFLTQKEGVMLFLQIVAVLILVAVLSLLYLFLSLGIKPKEIKQCRVVVVGKLIKTESRDTYYVETEYRAVDVPQGVAAPTVLFRRFYDGEVDIVFGITPGLGKIEGFGRYKIALLEEALPDIKRRLESRKE